MKDLKIGFIGLGLMGGPMVSRLLAANYSVTVWNRTPEKAQALVEEGARCASSIADLVGDADVVMMCLSDTAAVESLVFGAHGVAQYGASEKTLIDFSSIDPSASKAFATRLQQHCEMQWIDAPVSGGTAGAKAGTLIIMAGGNVNSLESVCEVFDPLCSRLTYMGEAGAGQMTKLCNQMVVACNSLVIAEMMALGRSAGVDVRRLPQALAGGFADSIPFQILAPQMAAHDFTLKWKVATLLKDIDGAVQMAEKLQSETPMSRKGCDLLRACAEAGNGERDLSSLITMYEPSA